MNGHDLDRLHRTRLAARGRFNNPQKGIDVARPAPVEITGQLNQLLTPEPGKSIATVDPWVEPLQPAARPRLKSIRQHLLQYLANDPSFFPATLGQQFCQWGHEYMIPRHQIARMSRDPQQRKQGQRQRIIHRHRHIRLARNRR